MIDACMQCGWSMTPVPCWRTTNEWFTLRWHYPTRLCMQRVTYKPYQSTETTTYGTYNYITVQRPSWRSTKWLTEQRLSGCKSTSWTTVDSRHMSALSPIHSDTLNSTYCQRRCDGGSERRWLGLNEWMMNEFTSHTCGYEDSRIAE